MCVVVEECNLAYCDECMYVHSSSVREVDWQRRGCVYCWAWWCLQILYCRSIALSSAILIATADLPRDIPSQYLIHRRSNPGSD